MRKGGQPRRRGQGRGSTSALERQAQQQEARAKREEKARQQAQLLAADGDNDEDIELDLFDEPNPDQANLPRKSPKKAKGQTPRSCLVAAPTDQQHTSPSKAEKKAAESRVASQGTYGKQPPANFEDATGSGSLPEQSAIDNNVQQPKDDAATSTPAPEEQVETEPAELLTGQQLRSGLADAVAALTHRLLDAAGGAAGEMQLRPSLYQVQQKVESLLSATVDIPGENHSLLLVGPRGVGKTLLVERAAAALQAKYNTDDGSPRIGFVKLTGLAHADERAAFREIARQLCQIFNCQFSKQASLEDNQGFLRDMLKEMRKGHKVVVFVLEDFDLFARKLKQPLLYSLLDAMQASDMQAAVLGMSCRSDVTEMLEKRVKSRFSYRRQLVLDPSTTDFGNQQEGPAAILQALLSLPNPTEGSSSQCNFVLHFNKAVRAVVQDPEVQTKLHLLSDKGCGCPGELGCIAMQALCHMSLAESLLQSKHLLAAIRALDSSQDSQAEAVTGLAILELFLLVALHRLRRKGHDALNFEMAFDEYSSLNRGGSWRGVDASAPRPSAFRAFERLLSAFLVAYVDSRAEGRGGLREFYPVTLLLTEQELEDGLRSHPNSQAVLLEWLKKDTLASYAADE